MEMHIAPTQEQGPETAGNSREKVEEKPIADIPFGR
jgi:hypothetical protein